MTFDKAAATAALADVSIEPGILSKVGGKPDAEKLSTALDELFERAKSDGETVSGVDYHIHGGELDHTSDLDETFLTIWLISGTVDEHGLFQPRFGFPNKRVPIVAG